MSARRRKLATAGIGVTVLVAGTVVVLAASSGKGSAKTPSAITATATVERRDLVQTDDQPGTLGYRDNRIAYTALGGTVTWVPAPGEIVAPDHRLVALDGAPVVLMNGSVPMYRPLSLGVTDGPDVRELEADLVADGYDAARAITIDDHYDWATRAAVNRWKEAHGLTQNGQVELGRIVFQPGPRRVTTLDVHVGQVLPPGASVPALVTTSNRRVATVQLDTGRQTEAVIGQRVDVTLPTEQVVRGVITSVGRVAQSSDQSGGQGGDNSTSGAGAAPQATVPVTIELRHGRRLPPLDQAPVTVAFAQAIRRNVLTAPVSALLATAGNRYAVDVVRSSGATTRVPVTPGMFAGGYVEIAGHGVFDGMRVVDTSER